MELDWLKKYEHFRVEELDDHMIAVKYKGVIISRYASCGVTEETLKRDIEEWNNNIGELERTINSQN